jgi:hypothetical protein
VFEELALPFCFHRFSTKKAQEEGKLVGPIEICCNDILFGLWEEECRTRVRKAAYPFERGKLDTKSVQL